MNGEQFLRNLATEIVAAGDLDWWPRYSNAFDALDLVGAVEVEVATRIGEDIRTGLTAGTGQQVPRFHLGSRRGGRDLSDRFPEPGPWPPVLSVRSAAAALPDALGAGGTRFVTQVDGEALLVCGGPGMAPWPERVLRQPPPGTSGWLTSTTTDRPVRSPEETMFSRVVDDHGRVYRLSGRSSSAPGAGQERPRWYLRSVLFPTVPDDVHWLRFETDHGPMTATLQPPVATVASTHRRDRARSAVEQYLDAKLHRQVWRHLLDPARHPDPIGTVLTALVAVDAFPADHPLVAAGRATDAAIAGGPVTPAIPPVLAAALAPDRRRPAWQGVAALDILVDHPDGARLALEAAVGYEDRLTVEFLEPPAYPGSEGPWARDLVVTATDDRGGGYVGHAESGSPGDGVFHLRPALDLAATEVTLRLDGPTGHVAVAVAL